eukprot:64577-Karenia_brevis.AAC.1
MVKKPKPSIPITPLAEQLCQARHFRNDRVLADICSELRDRHDPAFEYQGFGPVDVGEWRLISD